MRCEITGKRARVGNKVSHSNRKSKRQFKINVKSFSLYSESLCRKFRFKLAVSTMRTVDYKGGFDNFLLAARSSSLSQEALKIKKLLEKKNALKQAQS